jgi:hypothetical protein
MKNFLGFLWCLPVSIIGWLFGGLLALFGGNIEGVPIHYPYIFEWYFNKNSWFTKWLINQGWGGFSIGNNVFLAPLKNLEIEDRVYLHEQEHCFQQYKYGIFFLLFYILESLRLFFFDKSKHSYLDNKFEREARAAAGQKVDIPRKEWPDGPKDHWIWW